MLETIMTVLKIVVLLIVIGMMFDLWKYIKEALNDFEKHDKLQNEIKQSLGKLKDDIDALGDAWEEFYDKEYEPFREKCEEALNK